MNRNVPPRPPAHELAAPLSRGDRVHQEFIGKDKFLEVGFTLDGREVILNYPADGGMPAGHIIFSPAQARNLARILLAKADGCVQ